MTPPCSTYRIQFNRNFTFKHLDGILDYLEDLGITTIYAAPILKAAKNSDHGYNGIDPSVLNNEIGTEEELAALSQRLNSKGMTWVQDIVPNHLAYDVTNLWLYDVLERGINSSFAGHFDIDWEHPIYPGRLMVPFLEDELLICIHDKKLQIVFDHRGFSVQYYESAYPINCDALTALLSGCFAEENNHVNAAISALVNNKGTDREHWQMLKDSLLMELLHPDISSRIHEKLVVINGDEKFLQQLLAMQHFVFCHHSDSHTNINFRRFFNVNGLICLRVEEEKVFNDYHRYVHTLYEKGYIQGLRIDHVDGLRNPREYLDRLRSLFGVDCYIIVEKILDIKEELPVNFNIEGTSGYEFLSYVNQVITDQRGSNELLRYYNEQVPQYSDYEEMVFVNKLDNLQSYLNGEWDNLLRLLLTLNLVDDEEIRMPDLKMALGAFMAAYPVYRAYIDALPLEPSDQRHVDKAFAKALARYPQLDHELQVLQENFVYHEDIIRNSNRLLFIQRLMQFTGPLAAKGVEDTTFYRYNPLISHNEVGDQPCVLGIPVQEFHDKMQQRQATNPFSMNCTSTHDTKRGEDGRIRINIISEMTAEWETLVENWKLLNDPFHTDLAGVKSPIFNDEYFIYQALLGGFPEDLEITDEFRQRTKDYMRKVFREAKVMSNHIDPNLDYEEACFKFIDHLLNPRHVFLPQLKKFVRKIIPYADIYSMVQVVIKTTAPGIPDIYRGCELWDNSYVDPDNRRPVDFDLRKKLLQDIKNKDKSGRQGMLRWAAQNYEIGAQKIFVTQTILQLRKSNPELFAKGAYIPVYGDSNERMVIAYLRKLGQQYVLVVLPMGILAENKERLMINLPADVPVKWFNVFTEETVQGSVIDVDRLFANFPMAVLAGTHE